MHYDCDEFLTALAARIKALRQERGWTQMQMVRDLGYYLSHWQNIESGKKMSIETMLRVANTFDVGLEELI
jgi:transcriptional regulator with XRE-family HTH domain